MKSWQPSLLSRGNSLLFVPLQTMVEEKLGKIVLLRELIRHILDAIWCMNCKFILEYSKIFVFETHYTFFTFFTFLLLRCLDRSIIIIEGLSYWLLPLFSTRTLDVVCVIRYLCHFILLLFPYTFH